MKILKALALIVSISVLPATFAKAEEGKSLLGLQIGNVGVNGDVGNSGMSNTIGYGAFYEFGASDLFDLALGYIYSKHTGNSSASLTQHDAYAGAKFNLAYYDVVVPYLQGGADLVSRSLDLGSGLGSASASGFGLHGGVGLDFILGEQFGLGLILRTVYAFEQSATINGTSVKLIQNFNNIMVKFAYRF